jgi:hypothetical protein
LETDLGQEGVQVELFSCSHNNIGFAMHNKFQENCASMRDLLQNLENLKFTALV